MAVVLGLITAILFGSGDFFGGLAAKRTSVLYVVGFSHLIGLTGVLILAPFLAESFSWGDLALGAAGGAFGGMGVGLLYRGLARGPMAVVAPLTAITSAAVPAIWGVARGESLSIWIWIGIGAALVAIGLISLPADAEGAPAAPITLTVVLEALVAGVGFGTLFIFLDATSDASAPWPVVGARLVTSGFLLTVIFTSRRSGLSTVRPAFGLVVLAGLFDTGSNVIFLYATTVGDLTIVAVLSSLYPASTVVLARLILDERINRIQLLGIGLALAASALIAVG